MRMQYEKQADPFYKRVAWQRARSQALERDHWMCQDCLALKRAGARIRVNPATVVHHIKPREEHPELALELSNLISLCERCHNKRHPEKGGSDRSREAREAPAPARIIKV